MRGKGASARDLETLYRERFEHFARVASAICGDLDEGRDAVQTAFTHAVRERDSFRGTGPLEAWVWRILVNEARRLAREPRSVPLEGVREPHSNGRPETRSALAGWIASLPERQRVALFLRYYADLDYRTIAEVLGIEVGTVSATLNAARHALRKKLEEVPR